MAEFDALKSDIHDRMKEYRKEIIDIQASQEFVCKQLDDVLKNFSRLQTTCKDLEEKNGTLTQDLKAANDKITDLNNQVIYLSDSSRRNSLRFKGFDEEARESWDGCQRKVAIALREILGFNPEIERAHRLGAKKEDSGPREIIVKFLRFPDKEFILKNKNRLQANNIQIREDYCADTMGLRASFHKKIQEDRKKGNIAYARYRTLVSHPPSNSSRAEAGAGGSNGNHNPRFQRGRGGGARGPRGRGQGPPHTQRAWGVQPQQGPRSRNSIMHEFPQWPAPVDWPKLLRKN